MLSKFLTGPCEYEIFFHKATPLEPQSAFVWESFVRTLILKILISNSEFDNS